MHVLSRLERKRVGIYFFDRHFESTKSDLGYRRVHRKPRFSSSFPSFDYIHTMFCTAPREGLKMADENGDNVFRSEDLEDLTSAS